MTARTYDEFLGPDSAWFLFKSVHWSAHPSRRSHHQHRLSEEEAEAEAEAEAEEEDDYLQTVSSMISLLQSPVSSAAIDWRQCFFTDVQMTRSIVKSFIEAPAALHDLLLPFRLFALNPAMNAALNEHLDRYHPYYLILMPQELPMAVLTPKQMQKLKPSPIDIPTRTFGVNHLLGRHKAPNEPVQTPNIILGRDGDGGVGRPAPRNDESHILMSPSSSNSGSFSPQDLIIHNSISIDEDYSRSQSQPEQGPRERDQSQTEDDEGASANKSNDQSQYEEDEEEEGEDDEDENQNQNETIEEILSVRRAIDMIFVDLLRGGQPQGSTLAALGRGLWVNVPGQQGIDLSKEATTSLYYLLYGSDTNTDQWVEAYWRLERLLEEELAEYPLQEGYFSKGKLLYCAIALGTTLVASDEKDSSSPCALGRSGLRLRRIDPKVLATLLSTFLCSSSTIREIPLNILYVLWELAGQKKLWLRPSQSEQQLCNLYARLEHIEGHIFPALKGPLWGDLPACIDRWRRFLRMTWGISSLDLSDLEALLNADQPLPNDLQSQGEDGAEEGDEERTRRGETKEASVSVDERGPPRLVLDPSDVVNMTKVLRWWVNQRSIPVTSPLLKGHPLREDFLTAVTIFLEDQVRQDTPFSRTGLFQMALSRTALANLLHYHRITLVRSPASMPSAPWPPGMYRIRGSWSPFAMLFNNAAEFIEGGGHIGFAMRHLRAQDFLPFELMQPERFNVGRPTGPEGQSNLASRSPAIPSSILRAYRRSRRPRRGIRPSCYTIGTFLSLLIVALVISAVLPS